MAATPKIRVLHLALTVWACAAICLAQEPPSMLPATDKPLPDVVALLRDVEANQRKAEVVEKDYIYRSVETAQEVNGSGQTRKTTVTAYDIYWVNGVRVRRMVEKN